MYPPIEYETETTLYYEEARTDTVRSLIRITPYRERFLINDLLRLEHYATNPLQSAREAMDLRHLTQRYPDHAAAILAEIEQERTPAEERAARMKRNRRAARIRRAHERLREQLERESWERAGGLE